MTPLYLLPWTVETAITTITCVLENEASVEITAEQMDGLRGMYYPYIGLGKLFRLLFSAKFFCQAHLDLSMTTSTTQIDATLS